VAKIDFKFINYERLLQQIETLRLQRVKNLCAMDSSK